MLWRMAERQGRIYRHPRDGWLIEFRTVHFPGASKPKRVQIYSSPGFGRLETEEHCEKVLGRIHKRLADGEPLS